MKLFKHQQAIFDATKDLEFYALHWEMRVGKSLPLILTFVHHFEKNNLSVVFMIGPSGVHTNWARVILPEHRPNDNIIEWSDKASTKVFQARLASALSDPKKLLWLCINVEAVTTAAIKDLMHDIHSYRRCGLLLDESDEFKNPKAKRTKAMLARAPKFVVRRNATGTPSPQGPFDFWAQMSILDKSILGPKFTTFKQRYGIFKRVRYGGPAFDELVEYKDLDQLQARVAQFSSRLTKAEVYEDLPPVIPETRFFSMSEIQAKAYKQMKIEFMLELDNGLVLTASQAIVKLLRLQQISRGYIGDIDGEVHDLGGNKPSLEAMVSGIQQLEGKVIIWCRFRQDVTEVVAALKATFGDNSAVRYDGAISKEERFINKGVFLGSPQCRFLAGTPATGGIGTDLSVAETMIHYSHSYNLRERLQADARFEGPNQKATKLLMMDIVCADTFDLACLERLAQKEDMQSTLTGDKLRQLLKANG